ncbi:peroxiredoxin [Defluviimonas sp. WL0002]|uniref:Glutathione-dependent peroxiredoxin n=1 Tax=Albidovulum marisflavi TaxID=2984159 RepID=A0ABT2Z9P5_9RHOB|nr:peroxiredoxin [Defluviimonas sp. WL0002]MCV2867863.1 peroxiredoxin [Defluviimonas sp. WL0002]
MAISVGTLLPEAMLLEMGAEGPAMVSLRERLKGRRVVIFGLPGAFTGICSTSHVPSFIRTRDGFAAKGVDEVICLAVNDPFVMQAWGEATGAQAAGITMLADPAGDFTRAIGMIYSAPDRGLIDRSKRYALMAESGVVKVWHPEPDRGCSISGGEALLEAI